MTGPSHASAYRGRNEPVSEPTNQHQQSPKETSTTGLVLLVALVVLFAVWMYSQGARTPAASQVEVTYSPPTALAGFKADAWFLPDDPLLGFVEIPSGPFLMGGAPPTDPLAFDNERWTAETADGSQGTVDLPTFYIGRFEVTVAQFGAFALATGYTVSDETLRGRPDHPVVAVSWPDALAYCRWLESVLLEWSDTPAPIRRILARGGRVTLPTEAEWEKAGRGVDGRIYPWGPDARLDRANFGSDWTAPVGSYGCPECPFGLADISGNVWEWTRSAYRAYPFNAAAGREDLDADALWVMRGGSFADTERNIRTGIRGGAGPDVRRPFLGFRLAISP